MFSHSGTAISFVNEKNRSIVKDLIDLLGEANQEIPSWLDNMRSSGPSRGPMGGRGRGSSGGRNIGGRGSFGGRDFRDSGAINKSAPVSRPNAYRGNQNDAW